MKNEWSQNLEQSEFRFVHSKNQSEYTSVECLKAAELKIQGHTYSSNLAVGDARYYVILGMPCHKEFEKSTDFAARKVELKNGEPITATSV